MSEGWIQLIDTWGDWWIDLPTFELCLGRKNYYIDLLALDSEAALQQIIQLVARDREDMFPEEIGYLVRAIQDIRGGRPEPALYRRLPGATLEHSFFDVYDPSIDGKAGVYAIGAIGQQSEGCRVKIGRTNDVTARRATLQTGNADPLVILGMLDSDPTKEGYWHRRFNHLRVNNEWFQLGEQVAVHVRSAQAARRRASDDNRRHGRLIAGYIL